MSAFFSIFKDVTLFVSVRFLNYVPKKSLVKFQYAVLK